MSTSAPAVPVAAPARRPPAARCRRAVRRKRFLVGGRRPQPADRRRDRVRLPDRLHAADVADDERPGAVDRSCGRSRSSGRNYSDVFDKAPMLRYGAQHADLLGAGDAVHADLERAGRLRARAPALEGARRGLPARAGRDDAAAAGDDRAALRDVGEAQPGRDAVAADPPQPVRRRVLDLPAAPVLPDDPGVLPRRRARRRLRRVPHPRLGRLPAGQARARGGRAVHVPVHVQRLLRPAAVRGRPGERTGRCRSGSPSSARCTRCSGT